MKNFENEANVVAMESGDAYDQMLKGLFESCDTVGLGLLTQRDFERLCKKLSIQEHSSLLAEVLFPETNKRKLLPYDVFRDTLILFLTGNTDFSEAQTKDDVYKTEDRQTDCIEQISPITDDDWNNNFNNNGIENGNDVSEHLMTSYPRTDTEEELTDAGDPVIVSSESRKTRISPGQRSERYRRYGRKSKPDLELLQKRNTTIATERPVVLREVQMDNASKSAGYLDDGSPENSPWKALEVSFISGEPTTPTPSTKQGPIILKEDEFTGEGKDDEWTNPDAEWQQDYSTNNENTPTKVDMSLDSVQAAQSAIETAWRLVVGDPEIDAMAGKQLSYLCAELGMATHISTNDQIEQLFAALDQDNDGFVRFDEFSLQMSTFLGDQQTEQHERTSDRHADIGPTSDSDKELVFSNSVDERIPESTSNYDVTDYATSDVTNCVHNDENMTQPSRFSTPVKDVADENESMSEIGSNFSSPQNTNSSMEHSKTPDSRNELSLDSDTSPLCPPVVPIEPRQLAAINRGRRRRRSSAVAASNPAGLRYQQRRKSSRSVPLPHYHPASLRKLDELPLSYLTEENERYVSLDCLRRCWEDEGIERPAEVLDALQIATTEETVSVEALSEVFDMEMDQNIVQKAALILYKRGISHYRAQYDHEKAERCKQESNFQHLMSQIQEQEERIEKLETKHLNEKNEMDIKHKNEMRLLEEELTSCQKSVKKFEMESTGKQKYIELVENYEKAQELIAVLKNENENLVKERNDVENRLQEAEDTIMKIQEDLDTSCRGMALFSREHVAQKKQLSDILRMYEAHAQSVQDHNDELLDRLQQTKKRWTSCSLDRSKSPTFRPRSSASSRFSLSPVSNHHHHHDSSLGSSVSSISEIPHSPRNVSTYQFFVDDSIAPPNSHTSDLMTSSCPQITDSLQRSKPENILSADAFAFLTPSSTQARPRIDTSEVKSAIQDIHPLSLSNKIEQRTIEIGSL